MRTTKPVPEKLCAKPLNAQIVAIIFGEYLNNGGFFLSLLMFHFRVAARGLITQKTADIIIICDNKISVYTNIWYLGILKY